jgi:hypothetical protein
MYRIPSILTQLFWSATVGPWILWKIKGVNDVHSWAWQTRLAILAGYGVLNHHTTGSLIVLIGYPERRYGWASPMGDFPVCFP